MPRSYEVTSRDIRRFCQATGFPEPEADSQGRLTAPPLFCQAYLFEDVSVDRLGADGSPAELQVPLPPSRTVGGSSDFELFETVHSGDRLGVESELQGVVTKQGKSGTLHLVTVVTSFTNQNGKLVAREAATYIKRENPRD